MLLMPLEPCTFEAFLCLACAAVPLVTSAGAAGSQAVPCSCLTLLFFGESQDLRKQQKRTASGTADSDLNLHPVVH